MNNEIIPNNEGDCGPFLKGPVEISKCQCIAFLGPKGRAALTRIQEYTAKSVNVDYSVSTSFKGKEERFPTVSSSYELLFP